MGIQKKEKKELAASTKLLNFIYFLIVVAAAYYLSGLAVQKLDDNNLLDDIKIPKTDELVPLWAFQLVIGLVIFFFLQFLLVFLFGLIKGRGKNVYKYQPPPDQWKR